MTRSLSANDRSFYVSSRFSTQFINLLVMHFNDPRRYATKVSFCIQSFDAGPGDQLLRGGDGLSASVRLPGHAARTLSIWQHRRPQVCLPFLFSLVLHVSFNFESEHILIHVFACWYSQVSEEAGPRELPRYALQGAPYGSRCGRRYVFSLSIYLQFLVSYVQNCIFI